MKSSIKIFRRTLGKLKSQPTTVHLALQLLDDFVSKMPEEYWNFSEEEFDKQLRTSRSFKKADLVFSREIVIKEKFTGTKIKVKAIRLMEISDNIKERDLISLQAALKELNAYYQSKKKSLFS